MGREEEEKRRGKLVGGGRKWSLGQSDLSERSVTVAATPAMGQRKQQFAGKQEERLYQPREASLP